MNYREIQVSGMYILDHIVVTNGDDKGRKGHIVKLGSADSATILLEPVRKTISALQIKKLDLEDELKLNKTELEECELFDTPEEIQKKKYEIEKKELFIAQIIQNINTKFCEKEVTLPRNCIRVLSRHMFPVNRKNTAIPKLRHEPPVHEQKVFEKIEVIPIPKELPKWLIYVMESREKVTRENNVNIDEPVRNATNNSMKERVLGSDGLIL